jgi:uncharacterized protein
MNALHPAFRCQPSHRPPRPALGVMLLAVLLAGTTACTAPEPLRLDPQLIAVSGAAEITAVPDRAFVWLGIEARSASLKDAKLQANTRVESTLKLLRDLNVDSKYVNATNLSVVPDYVYIKAENRTVRRYYVTRQVRVDLRNLEQLGELMEGAIDLGINLAGAPQLDSTRRDELEREALARAVADARLNAEVMVKAAGARLGAVRNMSTRTDAVVPLVNQELSRREATMYAPPAANKFAGTYERGEMTFTASVMVDYDLAR